MSANPQPCQLDRASRPEPSQPILHLMQMGVTHEQIAHSHFLTKYSNCALEDRPFRWDPSIPYELLPVALPLLRWALIYRILASCEVPDVLFHKEAISEITMAEAGLNIIWSERHRTIQKIKASRPRKRDVIVMLDNMTMSAVVDEILEDRENRDLKPRELWPDLFAWLDDNNLRPKETAEGYLYTYDVGKQRAISFVKFEKLVRAARKRRRN